MRYSLFISRTILHEDDFEKKKKNNRKSIVENPTRP